MQLITIVWFGEVGECVAGQQPRTVVLSCKGSENNHGESVGAIAWIVSSTASPSPSGNQISRKTAEKSTVFTCASASRQVEIPVTRKHSCSMRSCRAVRMSESLSTIQDGRMSSLEIHRRLLRDKKAGRLGARNSRDIEEYILVNGRTIRSCAITRWTVVRQGWPE